MKVEARVMDVVSTLEGEKVGMSIDESALAHIMSVLTDLYSDPEMAVIREYSTNALDAHVEAGVPLPIEITLPSSLSPYLKIRDYGSGLDAEDIRTIYSRYGTSTKRDTNDLVGTLGLGCKSALTYTNQFTLQGIKDGRCIQVAISREEDGSGSMCIVADYETDEPSGVEITIPTKGRNEFAEKARYLFQFWEEGTVLVNGEAPESFDGIEIEDGLYVVEREQLPHSVVVMGNVPYPMGSRYNNSGYSVIAYVPIGDVQFTPSREALQETPKVTAALEAINERVAKGTRGAVERMINQAPDKVEALRISLSARSLFGYKGDLTYGKEKIPTEFDAGLAEGGLAKHFITVKRFKHRYGKAQERERLLPISIVGRTVFLTGYTNKTFSGWQRQKLEQWWNQEVQHRPDMVVEQFVLLPELPHSEWIDPARVYDFEATVGVQKITRGNRMDGRPAGAYEAYVGGRRETIQAEDIDLTQPVFYWTGSYPTRAMTLVRSATPDATIVELSTNREAKFLRLFPEAKSITEAGKEIAQAWVEALSPEDIFYLHVGANDRSLTSYRSLDAKRVDDPAIKKAIKLGSQSKKELWAAERDYEGLYTLPEGKWQDPREKYPLLGIVLDSFTYTYAKKVETDVALDHLYLYVNAIYQKETK